MDICSNLKSVARISNYVFNYLILIQVILMGLTSIVLPPKSGKLPALLTSAATDLDLWPKRSKQCFGFPRLWIYKLKQPANITLELRCPDPSEVLSIVSTAYMRPGETGDNCMYSTSCCAFSSSTECRADGHANFPQAYADISGQCDGLNKCQASLRSVEMDHVCPDPRTGALTCNSKTQTTNLDTGEKKYDFWCWARKVEITYRCVEAPSTTTAASTTTRTSTTLTSTSADTPILPAIKSTPAKASSLTPTQSTQVPTTTVPTVKIATDQPTRRVSSQVSSSTKTIKTTSKETTSTTKTASIQVPSLVVTSLVPNTTNQNPADDIENINPGHAGKPVTKYTDIATVSKKTIIQTLSTTTPVNGLSGDLEKSGNTEDPGYVMDVNLTTTPEKKDNNINLISWVAGASVIALIAICAVTVIIHIFLRKNAAKMVRGSSLKQKPRDNSAVILQNPRGDNAAILQTLNIYRNRGQAGKEIEHSQSLNNPNSVNKYLASTLPALSHDLNRVHNPAANQMTTAVSLNNCNNVNCDMVDNTYYEAEDVIDPRINNSFEHPRPDTDLVISKYKIQRPVAPKQGDIVPEVSSTNQLLNDYRIAPPPPPMNQHPSVKRKQLEVAQVPVNTIDPLYYELCEDAATTSNVNQGLLNSMDNPHIFHPQNTPVSNLPHQQQHHQFAHNINHSIIDDDDDYESTSDDVYHPNKNSDRKRLQDPISGKCINTHAGYSGDDDDDYYESSEDEYVSDGLSKPVHNIVPHKTNSDANSSHSNNKNKSNDYDYAYDHFQFEGRQRSK